MKKLIASVLLGAMLVGGAGSAFAEDSAAATELVLAESSHLVLDREAGYVDKIDGTVTVADLKANFAGAVSVAGKDGVAKADDAVVATDDAVVAGEDVLKALIYGDVNRDGKVNLGDVSSILKQIAKWETETSQLAADVNKDEKVNLADVSKMLKKIAKWDDISLGNVRMVFENTAVKGETDDPALQLFFTSVMNKLGVSQTEHTGEHAYKIKLAKNESESCQALLVSTENKEGLTAELTPFVSEYGDAELEGDLKWVNYYPDSSVLTQVLPWDTNNQQIKNDDHPEIVLDMADTFELKADRMQHMVISVTSTKDTPAGMYKAALIIKDSEGKVLRSANVYANVWDFTVPDAPYSASLFCTAAGRSGNEYLDYYNFMLDHNLSSYVLPYEITDPRADAYMDDPRVTAFVIAGGTTGPNDEYGQGMYGGLMDESIEDTVANYNKVASKDEWFNKGVFYYTDEPYGEGLFKIRDAYNYVTELLGTTNIRNMTPIGQSWPNSEYQSKCIDSIEFAKDYINVWCPTSDAYHRMAEGGKWSPRFVINNHGEYPERAEKFRERGDTIWWYVCCAPEVPYANYFTVYEGVIVRLLSWQQFFNNVDGVLYYATAIGWDGISKYRFDIGNGDGTLLYPGEFWGRTGPQASWRLLQIRDGFDDFDYLRMAEELCGREAVMNVVKKVSTGILQYTEDYNVLYACRDEIAEMILEAQK